MKLAIERAALLKSLGHVQSVVERRTTIPILSNVRLEASDGALGLTATDIDLSVVETTEAEVTQPGATTAPAHTLYDVVRKLPEGARVAIERSATRQRDHPAQRPGDLRSALPAGRRVSRPWATRVSSTASPSPPASSGS